MKALRTLIVAAGCLLPLVAVGGCDGFDDADFETFPALPGEEPPDYGGAGGLSGAGGTRGGSQAGSSNTGGSSSSDAGAQGGSGGGDAGEGGSDPGGDDAGLPPDPDSCGDVCAINGGTCDDDTCVFDCSGEGGCVAAQVICPANTPCDVQCGPLGCGSNVICSQGATCSIACEGDGACAAEVICNGDCTIECSGDGSCAGGIGGDPRRLELECSGDGSCGGTTACQGPDCNIVCSGSQACAQVETYGDSNVVRCRGDQSCAGEVFCSGAACDVECDDDACENGVDCRAIECSVDLD